MSTTEDILTTARQRLDHIRHLHWTGEPTTKVYSLLMHNNYTLDDVISQLPKIPLVRDLYAVKAQTLTLSGNVAFLDLGNHRVAERNYRTAARIARRSSDPRLQAWIFSKMAQRRIYDPESDPTLLHDALYYSDTAKKCADGNPILLASTYNTKAEVYASLGHEVKAMRTLDQASEQLRIASVGSPAWHSNFGPQKVSSMEGACWLRLGNARRAVAASESALAGEYEDKAHETIVLADAARGWAMLGDRERAVHLLSRAMPTAIAMNSVARTERIRLARAAILQSA